MHRHQARERYRTVLPFRGPIPGARANPAAHGNVCVADGCSCGALRYTNVNGRHVERGPWTEATPVRERR